MEKKPAIIDLRYIEDSKCSVVRVLDFQDNAIRNLFVLKSSQKWQETLRIAVAKFEKEFSGDYEIIQVLHNDTWVYRAELFRWWIKKSPLLLKHIPIIPREETPQE